MSNGQETTLTRKIQLALGKRQNFRIFRNNSGKCWIGASKKFTQPQTVNVKAGDVLVQQARYFDAGLCVGSSDLIGMKSVIITPDMVGKTMAVFTAIEVKTPTGKISPEQVNFLNMVKKMGGLGIICRDENNIPIL